MKILFLVLVLLILYFLLFYRPSVGYIEDSSNSSSYNSPSRGPMTAEDMENFEFWSPGVDPDDFNPRGTNGPLLD